MSLESDAILDCNDLQDTMSKLYTKQFVFDTGSVRFRTPYSVRKLFTGFATAALNACKPTVTSAIITADTPAAMKIQAVMFILYAKSCNH